MLQSISTHQKKVMLLLQNDLKKIRKRSYEKYRYNVTRVVYLKLKNSEKKETAIRGDNYPFIIIAIQDNKMDSWSLIIADIKHNYPPILPNTHSIY